MLLALLPLAAQPAAAEAPGIKVTFKIEYLRQIEDPDSGGIGDGDYFPRVKIADGPLHQGARIEDDEFEPFGLPETPGGWTFTQENLPGDKPTVDITVTLWDWDDGLNTNDDRMDISPNNDDLELNLVFDLRSGTLSGDQLVFGVPCVKSNGQPAKGESCIQGDGDHGFPRDNDGRITRIGITASAEMPDTDLDGIPDLVELSGIRNQAGTVLADLPALGADPCRKTVILQLDYMADVNPATQHSHQPKPGAITLARDVLDRAPFPAANPCPYAGTHRAGIDLIYLQGTQLAEQAQLGLDSNAYRNARNANFPAELARYAHYGIFAHDLQGSPGTSGQCCEPNRDNNKDFIVTLGSWRTMCVADFTRDYNGDDTLQTTAAGDDVTTGTQIHVGDNRRCDTTSAHATDVQVLTPGTGAADAKVGTDQDQAGTILHELFHAMGLRHGGDNNDNFKPNYLSLMNYFFQTGIPNSAPPLLVNQMRDWKVGNVRLGLSGGGLAQLDENRLNEAAGIGDGTDWTFWWTDNVANPASGFRPLRSGAGNGPLNWNDNATAGTNIPIIDTATVPVDINAENGLTILRDHNDWPAVKFRAQSPDRLGWACSGWPASAPTCAGAGESVEKELSFDTVIRQEVAFFAAYDPDLAVKKTVDKADAEPGDTLTYQVRLDNIGTGAAKSIVVKDTPPTGDVQTRQVGQLGAGGTATETFTYVIPCTVEDAAVLTNKAHVTATDLAGGAEAATGNNDATAATKAHAPKLTLDKRATATVNAGEAITVDLKAANVGSAKATGAVLTDTLPKEVYYSQALDQGAGPKPSQVTRNADGTTTLTWTLGDLAADGDRQVQFTVRPSLLFTAGAKLTDQASLSYGNAHGCTYDPVTASATTTITEVAPSRNPRSHGYWKTHAAERTAELRARIQATYQGFDTSASGALDDPEALAVLSAGGPQPGPAKFQLLATLFDLAARHINAATRIDSPLTRRLGTATVGAAVRYAFATLELPVNSSSAQRYSDTTALLDEIVNNRSEVY
ncbi:CARDB domain-containing protein [Nonomuraea sp. NPDC050310]|uniref:CARDB domain-containing protein n=1 Tax=Nonomuraea sp. NPDC050310 TaxID=3154935 RepID=UPI0033FDACA6